MRLQDTFVCADTSFYADPKDLSIKDDLSTYYHFCQTPTDECGRYHSPEEFADEMRRYGIKTTAQLRNYPQVEELQTYGKIRGGEHRGKHLFVQRGPVSVKDMAKLEELLRQ